MSTQSPQTCLSPELLKRLDHNELSPADLIDLDHQTEIAHPRHDQIATVSIFVRQCKPGAASLAVRTGDRSDLTERFETGDQALGVDPQGVVGCVGCPLLHATTLPTARPGRNIRRTGQVDLTIGIAPRRCPKETPPSCRTGR